MGTNIDQMSSAGGVNKRRFSAGCFIFVALPKLVNSLQPPATPYVLNVAVTVSHSLLLPPESFATNVRKRMVTFYSHVWECRQASVDLAGGDADG